MRARFYTSLVLFAIFACHPPESTISDRASAKNNSSSNPNLREPYLSLPDRVVDQGDVSYSGKLPGRGFFLAFSRWGTTLFAVFDPSTKTTIPLATKQTDGLSVSFSAGKIAYLMRDGFNPAKNHIEILDLRRKTNQRVEPAADFAILGFSLSPDGERVAYGQMNLRWSRSHRVSWRTGVMDLKSGESRFFLSSEKNDLSPGAIPVPFAWSQGTGELYVRELLPFRGMVGQGIWATTPTGSTLRSILPEPSYTGLPRLSPDGVYLAYLSTTLEALPRDYIPRSGFPPGNTLSTLDLLTGGRTVLPAEKTGTFGPLAWSPTGKEILVTRRDWQDGYFRDAAFLSVTTGGFRQLQKITLSSPTKVTAIGECGGNSFVWVEENRRGARLVGAPSQTLVSFPEGKIQFIGCLGD